MNPTVKQEWLTALRSGDYPQGRFALHLGPGYCCLGVLCDLYRQAQGDGPETWVEQHIDDEDAILHTVFFYQACSTMISKPIMDWVGLNGCEASSLAEQNDHGASFTQIAETIEAQY